MPRCFSFPVLDKKEICKNLSELGAPKLSVENLVSPSADALIPVYDFLVSFSLTYESREESAQPDFEAIQMLGDYPGESFVLLKTFTRLRKFMIAAGAEDFSVVSDVFRPESQRTIRFLSAAINFLMYSTQKAAFIIELHATRNEEIAKLEEVSEEKFKIESEIAQIEQEREVERPQAEALDVEIKQLNIRIQALNKQQHGLQLDINNLKQEDASILDKISNLDFEIMQKQQEGARLRCQLVENPQELQKTLQEKKSALSEEEALEKNASDSYEKWKVKLDVITKAEKKLLKHQKMLQALEEQVTDRNSDKVLKERKARVKAFEKEEWALDARKEELDWGVRRSEEQSEKYSQQCATAFKDVQAVKARQEQCRIEHEARSRDLMDRENQMEALHKKNADMLAHYENTISQFQAWTCKLFEVGIKYTDLITQRGEQDMHQSNLVS